jgi:tetratricopeptide (TPR) repeat protein
MAVLAQQAGAGDEDRSPRAALLLGGLLGTQGEVAGARGLLEQAIGSGHFEVAPRASLTLGSLLAGQEDPDQVGFFEQAAASSRREVAAQAALSLASYYAEQADLARTQAAYRQAIDAHHPSFSLKAAAALGALLAGRGDDRHAQAAWQQALQQPHLDPAAAFKLAAVCERWRDRDRAAAIYQRVLQSGHQGAAPGGRAAGSGVCAAVAAGGRRPSAGPVPARHRLRTGAGSTHGRDPSAGPEP